MKSALLVVDMINDFVEENGALYVKGASDLIPNIEKAMKVSSNFTIFCNDCHDENDPEFEQFPKHGIWDTWGSNLSKQFELVFPPMILSKNTFSAFSNELLHPLLNGMKVDRVYVCGVVTEICVFKTVIDSIKHGFKTYVIVDGITGLNAEKGDADVSLMLMGNAGAIPIVASDIKV